MSDKRSCVGSWTAPRIGLPLFLIVLGFLASGCSDGFTANADDPYGPYTNLQVLPKDTRWPELIDVMLANLNGLGLPRTGGEGCLFCHVGSMETSMETWDFASDTKPTKRNARRMMRMVESINRGHLAEIEGRDSLTTIVTCNTCHRGRTNPRPLLAVLRRSHAAGGMGEVEREYRRLRDEFFGRGAYDFRSAMIDLGVELADDGQYVESLRALEAELVVEPTSIDAHRWLMRLSLERAIVGDEPTNLQVLVDSLLSVDRPEGANVWYTFRAVGVRLRRAGKVAEAAEAFTLNAKLYPDNPRVITDLAETRLLQGDTASAVSGARRALMIDPAYPAATALLEDLNVERS